MMTRAALPLSLMIGVPHLCGWLVAGMEGAILVAVSIALVVLTAPALSPHSAMRFHGAVLLDPREAPSLYRRVAHLCGRAGLSRVPSLYWFRSGLPTAFAVGDAERAAIAVSANLVRNLESRELHGVLAHEVAHIAAADIRLLRFADVLRTMTALICFVGLAMVALGQILDPDRRALHWSLWLFALAPTGMDLLTLALSRGREFAADMHAAHLTGDPMALASALYKLETLSHWTLRRVFGRLAGLEGPSCLRTHPPTEQRIRRLREMTRVSSYLPTSRVRRPGFATLGSHSTSFRS